MNERRLELLGELTPAITIHIVTALVALLLGAVVLWRRKGTRVHWWMGRAWVAAMAVVALSSFGISTIGIIGPFSPIHLLSVYTLGALAVGIGVHRWPSGLTPAERIERHRSTMQILYASALLIAGGFTFLPWRFLGRMTFGETVPALNIVIVAAMVGTGIWLIIRSRREGARQKATA